MPKRSIRRCTPKLAVTTPIEPSSELSSAQTSSPASASQYPPDAATSSANAKTGTPFSAESCRMRRNSSDDCTGEPPGEFIDSATARSPCAEKARSRAAAWLASDIELRDGRGVITPSRRITVTTGAGLRNRSSGSCFRTSRKFMAMPQMGTVAAADQTAPTGRTLKRQRLAIAQHRLGRRRETAVRLVQHETGGKTRRRRYLLAGADQDTAGITSRRGPQRKDDDPADPARQVGEQRGDPIGAMHECDAPFGPRNFHRETNPVVKPRLTLDRGGGFRRIG